MSAELSPGAAERTAQDSPLALVADDEPLVRQLVCSVLARQGWRTIQATDGVEALGLCADERISLLITDYNMPAITGLELARAVRRSMPDLPVLVISGQPWVGAVAGNHGYRFLQKPFQLEELVALVRTLTDRQAEEAVIEAAGMATELADESATGGV